MVTAGLLLQACPGKLDDPEQFIWKAAAEGGVLTDSPAGAACFDVPTEFFGEACGGSACHGADSELALDLESADLDERLVGVAGTDACSGELFIDPSAPERSLLLTKLTGSPPCGAPMPLGAFGDALPTEEERECVLAWIVEMIGDVPGAAEGGTAPALDAAVPATPDAAVPATPDAAVPATPDAGSDAAGDSPLEPSLWTASASSSADGNPPGNAIDGDPTTRWASGAAQAGGEYFQLDLGAEQSFSTIVLDATGSADDYPRGYEVYVTNDPVDLGSPIATGSGSVVTEIGVPGARGRYIRIVQTGSVDPYWWSIYELDVRR